MWIGSEYDGIAVGRPGSWDIITEKDGLAGYEVKIMAQDADGTYWLGTNSGLNRVDSYAAFPAGTTTNSP
jgi:ligand-binding sensor domain-containing protein